jgi:hypothetical protein
LIQTHSHTFKFKTKDTSDTSKSFNNIISIVEEDNKKHHINYIQYQQIDENNILSRKISVSLDRLYFLEIANIAIDDNERRKRLFTVLGKRCFGLNDNKIDPYFLNDDLNHEEMYEYIAHNKLKEHINPILHELVTHNTNRYEAYPFEFKNNYFVALKQTNISNRKTFEKTFIVELAMSEYEKLLRFRTNELKIEFIFNAIGKIYFKSKPLAKNYFPEQELEPDVIIREAFKSTETSIKTNIFMNKKMHNNLKNIHRHLEIIYFDIFSKGMKFLQDPLDVETSYLLADAISKYARLLEANSEFKEIVSFMQMIKIFIQEGRISYLLSKNDNDIKDISQFLLETLTSFNASIQEDNLDNFSLCSLDLYNALKYYIDVYLKFYDEYKIAEAKNETKQDKKEVSKKKKKKSTLPISKKTSAKELLKECDIDLSILEELLEKDSEIINTLYKDKLDEKSKLASIQFLEGYSKVLNTFYVFKELSYSISILIVELSGYNTNNKINVILVKLLNKVINDLIEWKDAVFIRQDADDINYIDSSFYANVAQIDILINDSEYKDSNVELF